MATVNEEATQSTIEQAAPVQPAASAVSQTAGNNADAQQAGLQNAASETATAPEGTTSSSSEIKTSDEPKSVKSNAAETSNQTVRKEPAKPIIGKSPFVT